MELPSDIAFLDIEVPLGPLTLADPPSDPERLRSYIAAIAGRLSSAKSPAILVDADAARFGVASELMELAEKMQAPVAVMNTAKGVIDETFPHYLGIYIGKASEPHAREAIETSDSLLAIGYRPLEVTTGDFSASLPANTIHVHGHSVDVGDDNYQAVNGTSYALFGLKFPPKCTFVGSVNWGSIGYSVGALLGALTAAPERRHLLFVGSFQVTAQELSTILRHDHKPVIFLINNGGYTIERGYLGKTESYNDIANWSYADLPKVFRRDTSARSFVVKTATSRPERAERYVNFRRIHHGPVRRSRPCHE
jgi:indolepyruvate decarboxylase